MRVPGCGQVLQGRDGALQRMKEPVVGHVESRSSQFQSPGAGPQVAGGDNLLLDGLGQPVEQQNQSFAGADAQAGGNKAGVAGKSPFAVAEDAGDGKGDGVCAELGLAQ
jgi:hypothetical protein